MADPWFRGTLVMMVRFWQALAFATCLAPIVAAKAAEGSALLGAKQHHRKFEFAECLATLDVAAAQETTANRLAEVELYRGLCAYELSRRSAAIDHFQTAVKLDPAIALPPLTSPRIRQFFDSAVAGQRSQSRPVEPPGTPPSPAPPPQPLAPAPVASVAVGTSPLWRTLPWVTAGVAVAATGGYVALGFAAHGQADDANSARFQDDAIAAGDRARTSARLASVSLGVALVAAIATVFLWPSDEPRSTQ